MGKDVITITGDWAAWADPVQQGQLDRPDGESVWVLVRRRADVTMNDAQWQALKTHGRLMSRIDHPSVLRLLHTTKLDDEPAWVYEGFQAVSLARALDVANAAKQFLPARVAVEAVERTVQGLRAALAQGASIPGAPAPVVHLGPAPSEVLIDAVGGVRVAGFSLATDDVVDVRPPTGYAPHRPGTPEQRAVYGVGALLVHLLGGERPAEAADDAKRQEAVIRRAVIRVLARPGEAVSDGMPDLIRSCLAHDPAERPELTAVQDALSATAKQLRSAGLRTWCPTSVPDLIGRAAQGYPDPDTARMKRHIEPADDQGNVMFVAAPRRGRPPREVPTMVGKPPLPIRSLLAGQEEAREHTPFASSTSLDAIPTSETDVASMRAIAPVEPSAESVSAEISGREETWEEDTLARMGGWPLVAGALIGMVVAAAVGAVAVNHMTGSRHADQVVPPVVNPVTPVRAANPRGESDLQEEASAATERAADAPASAPTEPINDSDTDDASASLAGDREKPMSTQATTGLSPESTAPGTGTTADGETATETSAPEGDGSADESDPSADGVEGFAVTFRAEPGSVDRMRVRCHTLDPVDGIEEVFIDRAVKGPCRVEGFIGESKLSVSAVLKGPKSYTCFRDGSRICE